MAAEYVRPIFKWAGGKFRLLDDILPELAEGKRLVEPFVGSGAVFLNARQRKYLLCDLNRDLIEFYRALQDEGEAFVAHCRTLFAPRTNDKEFYFRQRDRFNGLAFGPERAGLFLYLNRHGYNGLVRYNARGEFNVPFGRYAAPYFPRAEMEAFLAKVRECDVTFKCQDFRKTMKRPARGDVFYCDPPYIPLSATANFTGYTGSFFGAEEQRELAELAEAAAAGGARAVLSNHDDGGGAARELYRNAARIREITVRRFISCNGGKRGTVTELLAVHE